MDDNMVYYALQETKLLFHGIPADEFNGKLETTKWVLLKMIGFL